MKEYLREDLRGIKPYKPSESNYSIKMDANESPYQIPLEIRAILASELLNGNDFHLYPDSNSDVLRESLANYLKVDKDNLMIGVGSDELIQIITNAFVESGDTVLCPAPSFSMYGIYTQIAGGIPEEFKLGENFQYNMDEIKNAVIKYRPKMLHLCSPNNPTGNTIPIADILSIARTFDGIVVVDEAYFEFSGESAIKYINDYPNLIILRTFSKAMGMAGLRVGYLICNKGLLDQIYKVKPPYNVNSFSQRAAALVLEHAEVRNSRVQEIINSRNWLFRALEGLRGVEPYPSKANFILMKVNNATAVYKGLLEKGILVRHYNGHPILNDHIRVTIGSMEDNRIFLHSLAEILSDMEEW